VKVDGKYVHSDTPLRRWRLVQGYTQTKMAELLGLTQRIYSRYDIGERIPYKRLELIHGLTEIPYRGLLHPREFLQEHPDFLREGKRPLQGRGWPRGRGRKIAAAR
jgi:transcriptional regulator with XRE-family HTH domain